MSQSNPDNISGKAWPVALRRELGLQDPQTDTSEENTSSFTSNQLREYIHRSYATLSSLQRQIYRGEESYFEESYAHGNIYSGWDNIWIEENNPDGGEVVQKSATVRKMPNDYRWFSNSSTINPRGDGKVETILSRRSLAETPQSVSPVKGEPPGRVLKRSSPLKVSTSPTKKVSNSIGNASVISEPANKKTKITDASNSISDASIAPELASRKMKLNNSKPMGNVSIDSEPESKTTKPNDTSNSIGDIAINSEPENKKIKLEDEIKTEKSLSATSISADKAIPITQLKSNDAHDLPPGKIDLASTDEKPNRSTQSIENTKPEVAPSSEADISLNEGKDHLSVTQQPENNQLLEAEKMTPSAKNTTKTDEDETSNIEADLTLSSPLHARPSSVGDVISATKSVTSIETDIQSAKADDNTTKSETKVGIEKIPSIPKIALPVKERDNAMLALDSTQMDKPIPKQKTSPAAIQSTTENTTQMAKKEEVLPREPQQSKVQVDEHASKSEPSKSEPLPANNQSAMENAGRHKKGRSMIKAVAINEKLSIADEKTAKQSSESEMKVEVDDLGRNAVPKKMQPSEKKTLQPPKREKTAQFNSENTAIESTGRNAKTSDMDDERQEEVKNKLLLSTAKKSAKKSSDQEKAAQSDSGQTTKQSAEGNAKTSVAEDVGREAVAKNIQPSTKKSLRKTPEQEKAAQSDSDSEEDVTLSQIVKMKSQATPLTKHSVSQTKITKSKGTRSSSRIRKSAR